MALFASLEACKEFIRGTLELVPGGGLRVLEEGRLRGGVIDALVYNAVFHPRLEVQAASRWLIRAAGEALGKARASIQGLYEAMGRGEEGGFTVPAVNIRGLSYDVARALFRAARRNEVGALVCEIARSEMAYTQQRPAEYAAVVTAAAIKENFPGPLFLQGDHFQLDAKRLKADPEKEVAGLTRLIGEALEAGFYNIDVDTSTLVDLGRPSLAEQQRENFERAAELTAFIRSREPEGVTVSVGGEIGEVGGKNSTVEEFRAFIEGYREALGRRADGAKGISKISIQTGTSHGGVVLPDGSVARVKVDFEALRTISEVARREYGLSGTVQHGASTLPEEVFDKFPEVGASEIHLATAFQTLLYEHLPREVVEEIHGYLRVACAGERKEGETDEQFFYKTRKRGLGPFKRRLWDLPAQVREGVGRVLEERFDLLMRKLKVAGTCEAVARRVRAVPAREAPPEGLAA
ncbi:MAG: class II fructose-bisphosphate aldolase [Nitrospinota bacterium]